VTDAVSPDHYKQHPSGIECIAITRHMDFCLGNAIKYIWRADHKSDDAVTDLRKAMQYLLWGIEDRAHAKSGVTPQRSGG
jgi:Protein of unknwon function (DUF3310)